MLPDAELRAIAANLAALRLDPVLHLKIAVAVVAPLMRESGPEKRAAIEDALRQDPAATIRAVAKRCKAARNTVASVRAAMQAPTGGARKGPLERARSALARYPDLTMPELIARARCGEVIAKQAMRGAGNGADSKPPARSLSAAPARDPDALARAFLEERLANGPVPAADVDAEVDAGRLSSVAVDRVRDEMDLVAVRLSTKRGAVACYITREQAAELDALVPPPGVKDFEHTGPRI